MSDLISRQVLLLRLADWQLQESPNWGASGMGDAKVYETLKGVEEMIQELPTIEPKKGEWIEENRRPKSSAFYCSVCHRTAYDPQNHRADVPKRCRYAFCPNCGARMESE